MVKPVEQAVLIVRGTEFRDWESVWVHGQYAGRLREFRFASTEGTAYNKWSNVPIKPGDPVTILLAGQVAVTGFVNVRQVMADAHMHGIQLQGRSKVQDPQDASVPGRQYRGYTLQAIAQKVLGDFGLSLEVMGGTAGLAEKFQEAHEQPGETAWNFIDRLARQRGAILGDDEHGNMLLLAGNPGFSGDALIEGQNIKALRFVVRDDMSLNPYTYLGQENGTDDNWAKAVSQVTAQVGNPRVTRFRPWVGIAERAINQKAAQARAKFEYQWRAGIEFNLEILVQGWLTSSGQLWKPGMMCYVDSPMCPVSQELAIWEVVFTQDNAGGSATTITLRLPGAVFGYVDLSAAGTGQSSGGETFGGN